MKSIQINTKKITVTYTENTKAEEVYNRLYPFEQKRCELQDNVLVYNISEKENKYIHTIVKDLIVKSLWNNPNVSYKYTDIDGYFGTNNWQILGILDVTVKNNNLFRITLINDDGTIGRTGFGCWQYGRMLHIAENVDNFSVKLKSSNLDDLTHEIVVDDDFTGSVLIEIGSIAF